MEQKHRLSSFKYSDSELKTQETPTTSRFSKDMPSVTDDDVVEEPQKYEAHSNHKTKGIRGFFKLSFGSGNKLKAQSNKKQNDQPNTSLNDDEIRRLIDLYSKYENLYNCHNSQYGNKQIENIYYSDMARSFKNKTGPQIQATIMELRSAFEREYALIQEARLSHGDILMPTIKYYNEFLFLVPFINGAEERAEKEQRDVDAASFSCRSSLSTSDVASYNISSLRNKCASTVPGSQFLGMKSKALSEKTSKAKKSKERRLKREGNAETVSTSQMKDKSNNDWESQKNYKAKQEKESMKLDESKPDADAVTLDKPKNDAESMKNEKSKNDAESIKKGKSKNDVEPVKTDKSKNNAELDEKDSKSVFQKHVSQEKQKVTVQIQTSESELQRADNGGQLRSNLNNRNQQTKCIAILNRPCNGIHGMPATSQDQRGGSSKNNAHQLETLCEMIKTELSSAPDCIYFDAKWRIIEILREVNKRQMIYKKGEPSQNQCRKTAIEAYYNITNTHNNNQAHCSQNLRNSSNSCPYCTNGVNH